MRSLFLLGTLTAALVAWPLGAEEVKPLTPEQLTKLHQMLKPQPGESRWMEIAWYPNVWEARQKAAAAGKPLFIMAGSGGAPPAGC